MAKGRICTGFSKPYVALYHNNGGNVSYTEGREFARGVSVSVEPEVGDDNRFFANNVTAESAPGVFSGGTATFEVDGLHRESERMIFGLPEPKDLTVGDKTVKMYAYGEAMNIPYVGVGYIARYMEDGVTSYDPTVLTKTRFNTPGSEAATQEDEIDWQTQELTATLLRDDTSEKNWKKIGEPQPTEEAAEAVIRQVLGIGNLLSIAVETPPAKTSYTAGEPFDPTDMVVEATYTTGRREAVKTYTYTPAGALSAADTEITISYTEAGITQTTKQTITVA